MSSQFVAAGTCKRLLLLAGDTPSHAISPEDKSVAMLFGDAGSATALEADADAPAMAFVLGTDGTGAQNLVIPAGGFRQRPHPSHHERVACEDGSRRSPFELQMDGLAVFNFTLKRVPALVRDTLAQAGWGPDDADAYLFHQANGFILGKIAKKLASTRSAYRSTSTGTATRRWPPCRSSSSTTSPSACARPRGRGC
jgi:3-oxoacyl-[acyl-carrier-protein] synthase-3